MEEQVKAPFWKPALIYGAILGFISVFLSLVFYFIGLSTESWVGWVSAVVSIAVLVYLMIHYRKEYLGGYASFGQIFVMVLVSAGIIATIISALYTYLLYTVIDPGLIDQIKIAAEEKIMSNSRIPESMYDDIFERMEKRTTAAYMVKMALIFGPVMNAVIGLIVAAFVKKEETINTQV
jgi:cation transport ATPase